MFLAPLKAETPACPSPHTCRWSVPPALPLLRWYFSSWNQICEQTQTFVSVINQLDAQMCSPDQKLCVWGRRNRLKMYTTVIIPLVCMGVQPGRTRWGSLRICGPKEEVTGEWGNLYSENFNYIYIYIYVGTAVAQWLRCCATNRKVSGSIPAGVIESCHSHKILPIALWTWGISWR